MLEPWLQIKGDPAVRELLFQQQRFDSLFDQHIDRVLGTVNELLTMHGAFHAKIHFSSNQLTCWLCRDPCRYRVYVGEEVLEPIFLEQFGRVVATEKPVIPAAEVSNILAHFKRLRFKDEVIYLRNASINRINGKIGMTFSCDGSHYIDYGVFYDTVELF